MKRPFLRFFGLGSTLVAVALCGTIAAAEEQSAKPAQSFRDCATDCPEMVIVPTGSFMMGAPATEPGQQRSEQPQHHVAIAKPFAVSKFALTFAEWDACAARGDCNANVDDGGWGRGRQPVVNVSFDQVQRYLAWLAKISGKPYRLLTEAEYEYAARAGTPTAYPWGDEVGENNANCLGCGSPWDGKRTAPVGSFPPNRFGLYDMVGNVWALVEDCYHADYDRAPTDGSAWKGGDCSQHRARGGSFTGIPDDIRSANRGRAANGDRSPVVGVRVARTLEP
jgi:formylglycine-generating enzyme required for sulfatase activity